MGLGSVPRYLVLARRTSAESLSYQATLDVDAERDPNTLAQERFGADWLELALAPERSEERRVGKECRL